MNPSAENVKTNLEQLRAGLGRACLRAGRKESEVTLVGVTKGISPELVRAAFNAGLADFGGNYLQEARVQQELLPPSIIWHFIGHLQSRKAREVLERFQLIHSLDREKLARELDRRAGELGAPARVLIEVNLSREDTKSGVGEENLDPLAELCLSLPNLSLEGLMTMPPWNPDPENSRPFFRRLRELRDRLARALALPLPGLSMGMSQDFEAAVEEGATLVRIGTAIFGPRKE